MAQYRIVCTKKESVNHHPYSHIVAVGTSANGTATASQRWTVDEVLAAMKRGDAFYTISESSGKRAEVEPYTCTPCRRVYLRSNPDAVTDNNLDNLRLCA